MSRAQRSCIPHEHSQDRRVRVALTDANVCTILRVGKAIHQYQGASPNVSQNIETVNTYLDGFRKNDHAQILSCLTDDIVWTVFGAFQLTGKAAYDKAIDGAPEFIDPPKLEVVRMVEQGDIVMAELTGTARRAAGGEMRMSMAEVFVMRDGKIAERRAWVIALTENAYR